MRRVISTIHLPDSHQIAEEPMDAVEAVLDQQRSEGLSGKRFTVEEMQDSGVAKRKAKLDARHRASNNKRAREEVNAATIRRYGTQQLVVILLCRQTSHRGLLGQTGWREKGR